MTSGAVRTELIAPDAVQSWAAGALGCYALKRVHVIKTTVRNGRIVVDEPTSLPDGHEVELCVVNHDGMSEAERHRLHASIARGLREGTPACSP
jgi:hypothetical protein